EEMARLGSQRRRQQDVVTQPNQFSALIRTEPSPRYRTFGVTHTGQAPAGVMMDRRVALQRQYLHPERLCETRRCTADRAITNDPESLVAQRMAHRPDLLMRPPMFLLPLASQVETPAML